MAFQDDLVATLSRSGVALAVGAAPSRENLETGLAKLNAFIDSLDSDTAAALQAVTIAFPVKALLSDPSVNIAPELNSIFAASDQANAHLSISGLAVICQEPLHALPLPAIPGIPTITVAQPEPFTLSSDSAIFVAWSVGDSCDKYHFMWTDQVPTPSFAAGWNAVELNAPNSHSFAFRIPDTFPGRTYTFKVQGCKKGFVFSSDRCSRFTADIAVTMPANTHSLRQFLLLSNVPLSSGIRSLGAQVFGAGLRAMMRV